MKKALPLALVLIGAVGAYSWYALQRSCEVRAVKEASALLIGQSNRFDDIYQVTTAASRTSLVRPVNMLQLILMDTQEVDVPACLQTAQKELVNYMGSVIRAFQAYGDGEEDATIRDLLRASDTYYDNFITELKEVNECAPFCIP